MILICGLTSWIGMKSHPFHTKPHYLISFPVLGNLAASSMTGWKGEAGGSRQNGVKKNGVLQGPIFIQHPKQPGEFRCDLGWCGLRLMDSRQD